MSKSKRSKNPKHLPPKIDVRLIILGILLLTFLIYSSALQHELLNWDDETYIVENELIHNLTLDNIFKMFNPNRHLIGNYHPITELSFAINYSISGISPKGYIATNLLLHLINTSLVFLFFFRFSRSNLVIPSIVALLFAIHPMHVESVCWISERKDLLYVFFFLLSMISYFKFLTKSSRKFYLLSLAFFLGALLSKGQAVTLPLILLLIHISEGKMRIPALVVRLGPFFILSTLFGSLAIVAQNQALTMVNLDWQNRLIVGNFGLLNYIFKLLWPVQLSAFHPYPEGMNFPTYFYIFPIVGILITVILLWSFRKNKMLFFGLGFFLMSIFPVLQFLPVGLATHADRYTYLPYIGLFYILANYYNKYYQGRFWSKTKPLPCLILLAFVVFFTMSSFNRIPIWKNSETLWADVIEKYPSNFIAYVNLSDYYRVNNQLDKAIQYADLGIQQSNHHIYLYNNKAYAMMMKKEYESALIVLSQAQKYVIPDDQLFINQGDCYIGLEQYNNAIEAYSSALELNPARVDALSKRGQLYYDYENDIGKSLDDFISLLAYDNKNSLGWEYLAKCQQVSGQLQKAAQSVDNAIKYTADKNALLVLRQSIMDALDSKRIN